MLHESLFSFILMYPFDYAVIAVTSWAVGGILTFFWMQFERQKLKKEVDRLAQLCKDWEHTAEQLSVELSREREIRAGLQEAFDLQKLRTAEILEKTNFLYVAMVKNGTLKRDDLKWLADQEIENIMKLFKK